jgi:hypothetical protein
MYQSVEQLAPVLYGNADESTALGVIREQKILPIDLILVRHTGEGDRWRRYGERVIKRGSNIFR